MYCTTKIHITHSTSGVEYLGTLYNMCYHSARLYNVGLYAVRQHFFNTQSYLNYYGNYHVCKDNENYKLLITDTGQQILRLVDRDMKSFFHLLKLKQQGKYSEKVKLPNYKDKEGLITCVVQGRSCRMHGNKLRIGITKEFRELYSLDYRYVEFTLPKCVNYTVLKEVRIVPLFKGSEFNIEFVYSKPEEEVSSAAGILSIDPGLDNLLTCTTFSGSTPSESFIIDGRYIKNVNYYYNKVKAQLQGIYDTTGVKGTTARMRRLSNGRSNRINNYFNEVVKYLMQYCKSHGIGTIVMGYNVAQKQKINTGHVNNQNFVMIPMHRLREKLVSICQLSGIKCEFQEESYTSKACALTLDEIPVYVEGKAVNVPEFHGKRVKRGLYKCQGGELFNADVNGSINIMRKYLKCKSKAGLSADDVRVFVNRPVERVNVLQTLALSTSPLL